MSSGDVHLAVRHERLQVGREIGVGGEGVRKPNTVKWLERSADRHEFQALNLAVHPAYANLRNSPGFLALKKRIGLEGVSPH